MVYYVMALGLYAQASYGEVLRCLLEGLRWLRLKGLDPALVDKSAITRARIRLGIAPLKKKFKRVAQPLAEPGLTGAWHRGRRLVSLDGTTVDLPDEPDLEQRFGRPSASRGASSFPQVRLLALMETGTHAIFAAPIGQWVYRAFEATFATEPVRIRMMGGTVPTGAAVEALQAPFVIVPLVNADNNQHSFNENMRLGNYVDGVKGILGLLQQEF